MGISRKQVVFVDEALNEVEPNDKSSTNNNETPKKVRGQLEEIVPEEIYSFVYQVDNQTPQTSFDKIKQGLRKIVSTLLFGRIKENSETCQKAIIEKRKLNQKDKRPEKHLQTPEQGKTTSYTAKSILVEKISSAHFHIPKRYWQKREVAKNEKIFASFKPFKIAITFKSNIRGTKDEVKKFLDLVLKNILDTNLTLTRIEQVA